MALKILDDLVDFIGHQHAIELLRAWGGRRLKVPTEIGQDHPLAMTIGLDSAKVMATYYGGTELYLPAERNFLIDLRNAAIVAKFKGGSSITKLSEDFGVSRRHVHTILDALGQGENRKARVATRT